MGSGKIKKSKMADPRWPSDGRHMTSSAYVADLKGNIFGCIICPPSFVVKALIFSELRGGGRISPPPPFPVPEDPKKPGLNRVNPLNPDSDENEISLYIVTTRSNIQIMRIKKVQG